MRDLPVSIKLIESNLNNREINNNILGLKLLRGGSLRKRNEGSKKKKKGRLNSRRNSRKRKREPSRLRLRKSVRRNKERKSALKKRNAL